MIFFKNALIESKIRRQWLNSINSYNSTTLPTTEVLIFRHIPRTVIHKWKEHSFEDIQAFRSNEFKLTEIRTYISVMQIFQHLSDLSDPNCRREYQPYPVLASSPNEVNRAYNLVILILQDNSLHLPSLHVLRAH